MADRYEALRALALHLGVDAVALVPGPNFERLYNRSFNSHERPLVVIVPVEGPVAAIVPNLELSSFAALGFEGPVFDYRDRDGHAGAFVALAQSLPIASVAVEGQVMRVFVHHALVAAWSGLAVQDREAEISALRLRKTEAEIAALEKAIAISEAALAETLAAFRIGMTEAAVARLLVRYMLDGGAAGPAFAPIVAAGAGSAEPHAEPREDHAIMEGEALLFDFGARWGGMNADITRTVFVGEPDAEARAVYETVLAANTAGHAATRPGATAHEVDDAVTAVLEASPFAQSILHKTGHGLGRAVHEAPQIMRGNHQVLEPGMVFTNEPGLYLPGRLGVRIEDDMLVTETGGRSLTSFSRALTVVG